MTLSPFDELIQLCAAIESMNSLHKYAVLLRARAVQPMNKHFLFFVLLSLSLPPPARAVKVSTNLLMPHN